MSGVQKKRRRAKRLMTRRLNFKFKVGQRVYLGGSGNPVVVVSRYIALDRRYYNLTSITGQHRQTAEIYLHATRDKATDPDRFHPRLKRYKP